MRPFLPPGWRRVRLPGPGRSIRVRLTLTYWMLFVVSGAAVLLLTVGLWQTSTRATTIRVPASRQAGSQPGPGGAGPVGIGTSTTQHGSELRQLLIAAGVALTVMAVPAIALGWVVAGRYLRPLRTITTTARDISASNLHERLELAGPDDELKELGNTFDDLLGRLERSFQAERRFIANASHELRTPLAIVRTALDVAMAKPGPLPAQTAALAMRIRPELDHIDRLLESFLTLAQTQQGPDTEQSTVSLSSLAAAALERRCAAISLARLHVTQAHHEPTPHISGSPTLLGRLVDNVVDNAVKHNQPGGWVRITTTTDDADARLTVENGGPVFSQDEVEGLTRPFRRLGAERTGSATGSGLGLSIVEAVAEAHHGTVHVHARQDGGLQVTVTLPRAATPTMAVPT
jgi:signal transduction histidine kinase